MANAMRPNDQMHLPGLGVPVDPWTGFPLKAVVMERLYRLQQAEQTFRAALHELDGTTPGSRPGDRRMAQAFVRLDEVVMWAGAAIMDHDGG
jgi:hypothetical protein